MFRCTRTRTRTRTHTHTHSLSLSAFAFDVNVGADRLLDENLVLRERAGVRGIGVTDIDDMHARRREEQQRLQHAKDTLEAELKNAQSQLYV